MIKRRVSILGFMDHSLEEPMIFQGMPGLMLKPIVVNLHTDHETAKNAPGANLAALRQPEDLRLHRGRENRTTNSQGRKNRISDFSGISRFGLLNPAIVQTYADLHRKKHTTGLCHPGITVISPPYSIITRLRMVWSIPQRKQELRPLFASNLGITKKAPKCTKSHNKRIGNPKNTVFDRGVGHTHRPKKETLNGTYSIYHISMA